MKEILVLILLLQQTLPIQDVRVELITYLPTRSGGWQAEKIGSCVTDEEGRCQIAGRVEAWQDGLVRGTLQVSGYGGRPVIWPGGELQLTIQVAQEPAQDQRYDHLSAAKGQAPQIVQPARPAWSLLLIAMIMIALTKVLYQKAGQQS